MITFLDVPYRGTNAADGFEILIHGFFLKAEDLWALCVDEEGTLFEMRVADGHVRSDWRFDRKTGGWSQLDQAKDIE